MINLTINSHLSLNDSLVSREIRTLVEIICTAALTTALCALGVAANGLNCLVFLRQGFADRMNVCLFSLSLADTCYLMGTFPVFPSSFFIKLVDTGVGEEYFAKAITHFVGAVYGLKSTSGCITTVIAVERCACVLSPFRASRLMSLHTMAIVMFLTFFTFQIGYLLSPFTYRAATIETDGIVHWVVVPTRFRQEHVLENHAVVIFLEICVPIASFVVVLAATFITVVKLRAALVWRETTRSVKTDGHVQQVALTTTLVIVSCIYVITMVPCVARGLSLLIDEAELITGSYNDISLTFSAVVNVCARINSTVHFFVYYRRSSRFREILRSWFGCSATRATYKSDSDTAIRQHDIR